MSDRIDKFWISLWGDIAFLNMAEMIWTSINVALSCAEGEVRCGASVGGIAGFEFGELLPFGRAWLKPSPELLAVLGYPVRKGRRLSQCDEFGDLQHRPASKEWNRGW